MKIAVGSDHAGLTGRQRVLDALQRWTDAAGEAPAVTDLGPENADSVDYPDYAHRVAEAIAQGEVEFGVLICGTGQGMAMAANRHAGVRAALITDEFTARMARAHNDANVACFGERVVGAEQIAHLLEIFLETDFEEGRHQRRVDKIER